MTEQGQQQSDDLSDRLADLWRQGQRPDVGHFLAQAGDLSLSQVAAVLRTDQRHRWLTGERIAAEDILTRYPALCHDSERALELVYAEYLLREEQGEAPSLEEFARRFPAHADRLRQQIDLHRALGQTADFKSPTSAPTPTPVIRALSSSQPLPEQFGRYRILKQLGQGGMGLVYLAHDRELDRQVALKIPTLASTDDSSMPTRFLREARAAASLHHANLCPVYDVGEIDGIPYFTMAYIEGQTLAERLRQQGALPQGEAVELTQTLALALGEAHDRGVIHRDLKPSNIMIDCRGIPIVMDFGLARLSLRDGTRLTQSGSLLGTPAYMAPEQAASQHARIGPATDIYSLGVVLYELLAGRPPFLGSVGEILAQIMTVPSEPPSAFWPGIDPRLDALCLKTLAKKPEDRPQSMRELAGALGAFLKGPQAAADPFPTIPMPATAIGARRRPRRRFGLISVVAVLGLGAVVVPLAFRGTPAAPTLPATHAQVVEAKAPVVLAPKRKLSAHSEGISSVAFSADGSEVLSAGKDHTVRIWNVDTGKENVGARLTFRLQDQIAFAPNGRCFIASMLASLELHVMTQPGNPKTIGGGTHAGMRAIAANGSRAIVASQENLGDPFALVWDFESGQTFRFKGHTKGIVSVALSADGKQALSSGADGIRWWDVESGAQKRLLQSPSAACLVFAPEAKCALIGDDLGNLVLWSLDTGQSVRRFEGHQGAVTCAVFSPDGSRILSGSADKSIRIWETVSGRELARLQGHTQGITAVACSLAGNRFLSGCADGSVGLWELASPAVAPNSR